MRVWRTIEAIVLLTVIAVGARYFLAERVEHAVPNVNGVTPGMSLEQAEKAVGATFKTIQLDDIRWELRGEGSYPVSVFLAFFGRFEQEREARHERYYTGRAWSVTGTELNYGEHRLSVGSIESLTEWTKSHPDFRRRKNEIYWELPEFVACVRLGKGDVPIDVGLTRKGEHIRGFQEPPPAELPVMPPGFLTSKHLTISGLRLGMSEAEVLTTLGEPTRREQDSLIFWREGDRMGVEVYLEQGTVYLIEGDKLEFDGEEVAAPGGDFEPVFERFGRVDDTHHHGFGGTPVRCWSDSQIKLHISGYPEDGISGVCLFDFTGHGSRFVCEPGCGGI